MREQGLEIRRDFDLVAKSLAALAGVLAPGIISFAEEFRLASSDIATLLIAAIGGANPAGLQHVLGPGNLTWTAAGAPPWYDNRDRDQPRRERRGD